MNETIRQIGGAPVRVVTVNTAVVGTGAAGYNAALRVKSANTSGTKPTTIRARGRRRWGR